MSNVGAASGTKGHARPLRARASEGTGRRSEAGAGRRVGLALLARPGPAFLVALAVYLLRAAVAPPRLGPTPFAYFNYLADAFLHGQLHLRLPTEATRDLVFYAGQVYLYWPPFPAVVLLPLVALFGVGVSDVLVTVVIGALTVALIAELLVVLDRVGLAPLTAERRAILVLTCAFGSVLLIMAPAGTVWSTSQVIGIACVLLATIAGLKWRGPAGYLAVGVGLGCALATRVGLLFSGVWLAYYLLRRDYRRPYGPRQWLALATWAVGPVALTALLLGWYNVARFGSPLELGIPWHKMGELFREDYARYGMFNLHYLPTNLYYQFVAYRLFTPDQWKGSGLFWMTPVFLGALYAVWRDRRDGLVWALVLSAALIYVPIGLLMGSGFFSFGPRYLLDLFVPLLVLTARGIREWRLGVLRVLMYISCATYLLGSIMLLLYDSGVGG